MTREKELPKSMSVGGEISIGKNAVISESATINVKGDFTLGDNSYIGPGTKIICSEFAMGDYGKIHDNCLIYGYKHCNIGHNLWVGCGTIIDTIGGVDIGDNCGIGAYSQLWTHIRYGDTLEGCRWNSSNPLKVEDDVWFVGHCIISPIVAKSRSMAMAGSVVTRDMEYNKIYAGMPAKDITEKIGNQFEEVPVEEKFKKMSHYLKESGVDLSKVKIIFNDSEIEDESVSYFNVSNRTYTKRLTEDEIQFMNHLLPVKAKFVPAKRSF